MLRLCRRGMGSWVGVKVGVLMLTRTNAAEGRSQSYQAKRQFPSQDMKKTFLPKILSFLWPNPAGNTQMDAIGPEPGLCLNERIDMGKAPEVDNPVGNFLDGIITFRAEDTCCFRRVRQHVVATPNLAIL